MATSVSSQARRDWTIELAKPDEAERLASIQISRFQSNELFKIQFPTPEVAAAYQVILTERIRAEIQGSHATVLVLRSKEASEDKYDEAVAVAFAIWRPPHPGEEADLHAAKEYPKGTNMNMMDRWREIVNKAYSTATKDRKCYRLDWLVSDSQFEGQGAGSVLLQWGLDKAESEQLPVYLESTLESSSFYEKRGFKQVAEMNVALDECETWIYHEVGLLWEP